MYLIKVINKFVKLNLHSLVIPFCMIALIQDASAKEESRSCIYVQVNDGLTRENILDASISIVKNGVKTIEGVYIDSLDAYIVDTILSGEFSICCEHPNYEKQLRKCFIPKEYIGSYDIVKFKLNSCFFHLGKKNSSYTHGGTMPFIEDQNRVAVQGLWFNTNTYIDSYTLGFYETILKSLGDNYQYNSEQSRTSIIMLRQAFPEFDEFEHLMDSLGIRWSDNAFANHLEKKNGSSFTTDSCTELASLRKHETVVSCGPPLKGQSFELHFTSEFYLTFLPGITDEYLESIRTKYGLVAYEITSETAHLKRAKFYADPTIGYHINTMVNTIVQTEKKVLTGELRLGGYNYRH